MNIKLRREDFFNLMNNVVFGKTVENVRKHRSIKLKTLLRRRNQQSQIIILKSFSQKNLLAIEMIKSQILVYVGLSILNLGKTLMYEF